MRLGGSFLEFWPSIYVLNLKGWYIETPKIKIVYSSKCRPFWMRGGGYKFSDFSLIHVTEKWPLFLRYLRLISVRYMQHLVNILWPLYEWNSPHVSVWCDFGTSLVRVRGGAMISNSLHFKFFPISVEEGGSLKINFFPNSK